MGGELGCYMLMVLLQLWEPAHRSNFFPHSCPSMSIFRARSKIWSVALSVRPSARPSVRLSVRPLSSRQKDMCG